jgi:hypothetical protein
MFFMRNKGWYCQFLEEDLKTPLPRKFTFATEEKSEGVGPALRSAVGP